MVFTSVTFLFYFLPIFLLVYFLLPRKTMVWKNCWILIGSLFFYAWGEFGYVVILILSIFINYVVGRLLSNNKNQYLLLTGVGINLLLLVYYKYAFFILTQLGFSNINHIHLPLGISFFTFQGISYIVDIYRNQAKVEKNIITLGTYIALFPQLIAGPIVRFKNIQTQLHDRSVTYTSFAHGAFLLMTGVFYKVVLADNLGKIAHEAFELIGSKIGTFSAWLGLIGYSFQIYFDFCGYSVMAVGLGLLMGFTLPVNFRYPYISSSITEFWRRWHITLSTWFKDYLYIPLGGNRRGVYITYRNLWIVFLLCGLWHGAAWTFVFWGIYHGFLLIVDRWLTNQKTNIPTIVGMVSTFLMVTLGWVLFRSENLNQATSYFSTLFSYHSAHLDEYFLGKHLSFYSCLIFIIAFVLSTPLVVFLFGIRDSKAVLCDTIIFNKIQYRSLLYGFSIVGFIYAVSTILSASYSPFIYFRF